MSTLRHIVCRFSVLAPMLFSHRDRAFSMVVAHIYRISQLPLPSRFHLDHSWGLYITRLARGAALGANLICARLEKAAKPGCARRISAAGTQARRPGSWHAVRGSRLPSTVPAVSFCHLQKESQMLWHDKAARLARRSGYAERQKVMACHPLPSSSAHN